MPSLGKDNIKIFNSISIPESTNSSTGGLFLLPDESQLFDVTDYFCLAGNEYGKMKWSPAAEILSLGNLSDVTLTPPLIADQVLTYNGTVWVNSFSGDSNSLEGLDDVDVTPPIDGYSLTYNAGSTFWEQVFKEDYLGLPVSNGQVLSSTTAGIRSWITIPSSDVLSVNGQTGVVVLTKADIGLGNVDDTSDLDKPISTATQDALDLKEDYLGLPVSNGQVLSSTTAGVRSWITIPPSDVLSVNGQTGVVVLDKADIGLGNVDNTSDLDKPISTATQDALDLKEDYLGLPVSNGQVLSSTTAGVRSWITIPSAVSPGGADTQIQFNDSATFGGISSWTTNGTTTFNGSDNAIFNLGTGFDFSLTHDGTDTLATSNTGDFILDNTNSSSSTIIRLGDDLGLSDVNVQNNNSDVLFHVNSLGLCTLGGLFSNGSPVNTGSIIDTSAQFFTDTATAGSGTATAHVFSSFSQPTLAAANASVTTTDAATVYIADAPIAGANQTITNPWALWINSGNVQISNDVYAASYNTVSDARLKDNIEPLSGALDLVKKMNGYSYNLKEDQSKLLQYGVLAQELEKIGLAHIVHNKCAHKTVNYLELIPLLIEAIKELANNSCS
jgi:hypothetical protein